MLPLQYLIERGDPELLRKVLNFMGADDAKSLVYDLDADMNNSITFSGNFCHSKQGRGYYYCVYMCVAVLAVFYLCVTCALLSYLCFTCVLPVRCCLTCVLPVHYLWFQLWFYLCFYLCFYLGFTCMLPLRYLCFFLCFTCVFSCFTCVFTCVNVLLPVPNITSINEYNTVIVISFDITITVLYSIIDVI